MSRRRQATYEHVALDIVCPRGHRVGLVAKNVPPSPAAGRYITLGGTRFEEWPEPGDDSGRVRGSCEVCGADVQVSWKRAKDALDDHEARGQHTGELQG